MHDPKAKPAESPPRKRRVRVEAAGAIQRLVEAQRLTQKQRILCYGCGRGIDVDWLQARHFQAFGYDTHAPYGYEAAPRGKFDFVFLIFLLTRLKTDDRRREAITAAADFARPGGTVALVSRHIARIAGEAGHTGVEGVLEYATALMGSEFASVEYADFDCGDGSLCVLGRRAGVHQPRNPVSFVAEQAAFEALCARLLGEAVVGLDVETTLEEPRELCTVQLSTPRETWVIDVLALKSLDALKSVMESSEVEKVIHNALFEEQMLAKHGIRIANVFDTLTASRNKYKGKNIDGGHNLGAVCERELKIYLDKSLQTSDWTQRPLDPAQIAYAAIDAEVMLPLYSAFKPPRPPEILELFTDV